MQISTWDGKCATATELLLLIVSRAVVLPAPSTVSNICCYVKNKWNQVVQLKFILVWTGWRITCDPSGISSIWTTFSCNVNPKHLATKQMLMPYWRSVKAEYFFGGNNSMNEIYFFCIFKFNVFFFIQPRISLLFVGPRALLELLIRAPGILHR